MVNVMDNMSSEGESEDGIGVNNMYKRKCELIIQRCEAIQMENECLVHRIHRVKQILKRKQKERKFLMQRLDNHGDRWRSASMPFDLQEPSQPKSSSVTSSSLQSPASKTKSPPKGNLSDKTPLKKPRTKSPNQQRKKPVVKQPIDKNAPKRPGNPYLQFCQEQRSATIEEMASKGMMDPSKVEITKHLANKWNALTQDDKKQYYDMYEKSKEKWNADMQRYTLSKGLLEQQNNT